MSNPADNFRDAKVTVRSQKWVYLRETFSADGMRGESIRRTPARKEAANTETEATDAPK